MCSRAVVIDKGRIVADGTADALEARSPYHNAVALRIASGAADRAKAALEGLASVAKVEITGRPNGAVALRAIPKAGSTIAGDVAALLREKSIDVEELYIEKGRLDDVFRQITTGTGRPSRRANA